MIDLEWYRTFVHIYQAGTISAAASRRSMTQPGLSQHLAALERALGQPLFKRLPRQMQPTPAGRALYAEVIGAVERLERVSTPAAVRPAGPLRLRLGAPREYLLTLGLSRLRLADTPELELQTHIGETLALIDDLEAGELDAVIATQRIARRNLHYLPLMVETFVLITPTGRMPTRRWARPQLAAWLEDQTWVAYGPDLPIIRRYWQEVFQRRPNLRARLVLPDLLMVLRAVSLGYGLSILPDYLVRDALEQRQVEAPWRPPHPPSNPLWLVFARERADAAEVRWLRDRLLPTDGD